MRFMKKYGALLLALLVLAVGSAKYLSHISTVSNNVNGRELPIYSVETDKKQVALSFDAAWAGDN